MIMAKTIRKLLHCKETVFLDSLKRKSSHTFEIQIFIQDLAKTLNTVFSIRVGVGGKTSKVGGEGTTRAEGTILGWWCMGASPTRKVLKIWTS